MYYPRPIKEIIDQAGINSLSRMREVAEAKRHTKYKYKENLKSKNKKK